MKKTFFSVFFLIFLTLITCTLLAGKIEEEMTLEVIGYEKRESFDAFTPPKDMLFTDEEGSHLYEVYQGAGWESGLRAREIPLYGGSFNVDRNYIVARGASRQPVYGEQAQLYNGKDTAPSTYVAWYPDGIPRENKYLFQVEILEKSDHALLLYQENGVIPFMENRAKGGMVQLAGSDWRVYSLDAMEQLLNNVPHALTAVMLVFAVAVLGCMICVMIYREERNKWLLAFNGILIVVAFVALSQVLKYIDLPASMLPAENIFHVSHYRTMVTAAYTALEELSGETTARMVELRNTMLGRGYGILFGGGAGVLVLAMLELGWHMEILKVRPRYQGKYLKK